MLRTAWLSFIALGLLLAARTTALGSDQPVSHPAPGRPETPVKREWTEPAPKWILIKIAAPARDRAGPDAWADPRVAEWVCARATVLSVDAEKGRTRPIDIATPAIVAFRDFKEFDRIPCYQCPTALLEWFAGLERGEKSIELVVADQPIVDDEESKALVSGHWWQARDFASKGEDGAAAAEYLWLWENMPKVHYCVPLVARNEIARLAARSDVARKRFADYRDAAGRRLDAEKVSWRDVADWMDFNRFLDDQAVTLRWLDQVAGNPRFAPILRRFSSDLSSLLIANKRWSDIARLFPDPMYSLEELRSMEQGAEAHPDPENTFRETLELIRQRRRSQVGMIHAALLAAGKEGLAREFATKAREYFGSGQTARDLATWALRAGQPRMLHVRWLSEEPNDEDSRFLLKVIQRALKRKLASEPSC